MKRHSLAGERTRGTGPSALTVRRGVPEAREREIRMSQAGFKVFDSDLHVLEPADLWPRYVDAEFKDRSPSAGCAIPATSR